MSETRDPAIKLFGKTIPLPEIAAGSGYSAGDENHASSTDSSRESHTNRVVAQKQQETVKVCGNFGVHEILNFEGDPLFGM